jgi:hypothetical protein
MFTGSINNIRQWFLVDSVKAMFIGTFARVHIFRTDGVDSDGQPKLIQVPLETLADYQINPVPLVTSKVKAEVEERTAR